VRFLDSLRRMGLLPALLLAFATPVRATGASAGIRPYVLDCGRIDARDMGRFDHSGALDGKPGTMSVPCFLVRHPKGILPWETGLGDAIADRPDGLDLARGQGRPRRHAGIDGPVRSDRRANACASGDPARSA